MKKTLQLASGIFFFFLILQSCEEEAKATIPISEPTSKKIVVQKAQQIDYHQTIFTSGKLITQEATKLSFKKGGQINKIFVKNGQTVRQGQLLATVDVKEANVYAQQANLNIEQSDISIENVKLLLEKANRDYENTLGLYQDSVATLEQLENARTSVKGIENQLLTAQKSRNLSVQNQTMANFNLEDAKIFAPANGTILQKYMEQNEIASGGLPIFLFTSQQKSKMIKVHVTDKEIVHVQNGDPAKTYFDAYPDKIFEGKVIEISQMADPVFNTFEVKISLQPTSEQLFIGFIGNVEIKSSENRSLISIPVDALVSANGKIGTVFTLKNQKIVETEVSIFKLEKDQLLIQAGLENGQQVVISDVTNISPQDDILVSNK